MKIDNSYVYPRKTDSEQKQRLVCLIKELERDMKKKRLGIGYARNYIRGIKQPESLDYGEGDFVVGYQCRKGSYAEEFFPFSGTIGIFNVSSA